ncbi:serine-rich adhesin for platelets-like [Ixodes scapularis]
MDQVSEERRRSSVQRRPPSEQLVDLHVYFVPEERWLRKRKLARNHVVDYAISAGFISGILKQEMALASSSRPRHEQLVDLHVYFVPEERWLRKRKLARNHVVDYAISAGFIRIVPTSRLVEVRQEIGVQLGNEVVPDNYVFLKSVGRNFTQVKASQEMELKAKNFMPPYDVGSFNEAGHYKIQTLFQNLPNARIVPTSRLVEVRQEIGVQLGNEVVPDNYVFLKSVGRNFTQVKASQEMELKAKNFMPPYVSCDV